MRMLEALTFAFLDSVNVLLIGVLVALGVILRRGAYRRVVPLLVAGDWLGVLTLALLVLTAFDGLGQRVQALVNSPVFGVLLIITGFATAALTLRGGDSSALVARLLGPLRVPSWRTVAAGFLLGVVQSATSVPFFAGLLLLSAEALPEFERYLGLLAYATVALSLPTAAGLAVAAIRHRPESWLGQLFTAARRNQSTVARGAGYLVSLLLVAIGAGQLM